MGGVMEGFFDNNQDEQAGQQIWQQLQNKQVTCDKLTTDDFDKLGDYFMGQMTGSAHEIMDQAMIQRFGKNGEKQMHIAMGERFSGCNPNAAISQNGNGFSPMIGGVWPMMGFGYGAYGSMMGGWGILGAITWTALIAFLVLGIIYFWKGIRKK